MAGGSAPLPVVPGRPAVSGRAPQDHGASGSQRGVHRWVVGLVSAAYVIAFLPYTYRRGRSRLSRSALVGGATAALAASAGPGVVVGVVMLVTAVAFVHGPRLRQWVRLPPPM